MASVPSNDIQCILCVVCGVTFNASHYDWLSSPPAQLCTITGNVTGNAETTGRERIIDEEEEWIYQPKYVFLYIDIDVHIKRI